MLLDGGPGELIACPAFVSSSVHPPRRLDGPGWRSGQLSRCLGSGQAGARARCLPLAVPTVMLGAASGARPHLRLFRQCLAGGLSRLRDRLSLRAV